MQVRFGGKGRDPREVCRGALIEVVEPPDLLAVELRLGIALQPVESLFQFGPERMLLGEEVLEIDDHSACLCLTRIYCSTSSGQSFS